MGLRENVVAGLRTFSHLNPDVRKADLADRSRQEGDDRQKRILMATMISKGVQDGLVDRNEAATALNKLGFGELTSPGNAPPTELAGQGGGPPTMEQSEAQRTTLFGPEASEPKDYLSQTQTKHQRSLSGEAAKQRASEQPIFTNLSPARACMKMRYFLNSNTAN